MKRLWIEKVQWFPYLMSWYKYMRNHFGKLSRLMRGYTSKPEGTRSSSTLDLLEFIITFGSLKEPDAPVPLIYESLAICSYI